MTHVSGPYAPEGTFIIDLLSTYKLEGVGSERTDSHTSRMLNLATKPEENNERLLVRISRPPCQWPLDYSCRLKEQRVLHVRDDFGREARQLLGDRVGLDNDDVSVVAGGDHAEAGVVKHAHHAAVQRLVLHGHILEVDSRRHVPDLPVEDERAHKLGLHVLHGRVEALALEHVGGEQSAADHEAGASRLIDGELLEGEEAAGGGH